MNESEERRILMTDPAPTLPEGRASLLASPKSNRPKRPYAYCHSIPRPEPSASSAH
jgi:hypothetical protein